MNRSTLHLLTALSIFFPTAACSSSSDEPSPTPPAADAAPEAGAESGPEAEASAPETSSEAEPDVPEPDAAKAHSFALFVGSNYADNKAELAALDLSSFSIVGRLASDDQDTVAAASGARGFLLHRTVGKVSILDQDNPSVAQKVIDVSPGPDAGKANPYAVVVGAGSQAFVVRYGQNSVSVIDLTSGASAGEVDLSSLVADGDGLVDAFDGVFDETKGIVYVGLQRIDQTVFGDPPDYVGACTTTPALIVAIDAATKQLVGQPIELHSKNPATLAWDAAGRSILVMGTGCAMNEADGGSSRAGRGVEELTVDDSKIKWVWQTEEKDRPSSFILMPGKSAALVGLDDATYARHWWWLDLSQGMLTSELKGMPMIPVYAAGAIYGLATQPDAGTTLDVVRYDLISRETNLIAEGAFSAAGLNAYSSAVINAE
jgi:hypothetical protein